MKKYLTTFLPVTDLSKEKEYLYFGAVNAEIQNFLNSNKFNFSYGFTNNTKKERIDALKYCDSFTDKIIQSLTKNLNMIHGTQYSEKIWKVIFGRWLKDFIYICYFNFNHLEKLNNDYNFEKIFSLKYLDKEFVSSNSNSLVCLNLTPEWNSKLSTKILEFIGKKNRIRYISDKDITKNIVIKNQKNNNKIFKIIKNIFLIFNNFFNKRKKFFFFQSGLGFLFEKKIELKLNQTPSYWQFPTLKNEKYQFDEKMRKKIICELSVDNNFEKFLTKNIHLFLPIYIIEEFKNINQQIDSMTLPKNIKLIITGIGFVNEYFNIFAAKKMLQKSKYINLQHGNSYHTHYSNDFVFENSELDHMITWGPMLKQQHKPLFNTNVLNQENILNKNGQNLTIICNQLTTRPLPYDLFLNKERNFLKTIEFANSLDDNIKQNTSFRLFPANVNDFNNNLKKFLEANNLNFYKDHLTYKEVIRNTKICLFNYESTGFYENLILNIPSIYYCTDNFIDLKEDVIADYELLVDAKIIFKDKLKLIKHLNEIWDNPSMWWDNPKTKEKINNFNSKYNRPPNKAIERFANCLKNLI